MKHNLILISACLIGERVRYDGNSKQVQHPILTNWLDRNILLPLCPEVSGGLPVPRLPAEIQRSGELKLRVINCENTDLTRAFERGANKALSICLDKQIKLAILTEGSPSCGSGTINDGLFSGNKVTGEGITTRLLRNNGIQVFNQHQLEQASKFYRKLAE